MQTIQIIQEKIKNYTLSNDYTPIKVTINIRPPLYTSSPYIFLDGILAYLCLREALGEDYWSLPTDYTVDISKLDIPLKRTHDMYHCSVGLYDKPYLRKDIVYKRFTDKEIRHLTEKQQKGRIRTNSGYYKDKIIRLPLVLTDKITWYANGDKQEIQRLLGHITHIGKKTSIGGGYIKNIKINETAEDYSFNKNNKLISIIPTKYYNQPPKNGDEFKSRTYKPPYWDNSKSTMCIVPENQLI